MDIKNLIDIIEKELNKVDDKPMTNKEIIETLDDLRDKLSKPISSIMPKDLKIVEGILMGIGALGYICSNERELNQLLINCKFIKNFVNEYTYYMNNKAKTKVEELTNNENKVPNFNDMSKEELIDYITKHQTK